MEITIRPELSGALTNIASLNKLTEQETVEKIINDVLVTEFKNMIYAKIQAANLEDFKQMADVMETKVAEIATAKEVKPIEEVKP